MPAIVKACFDSVLQKGVTFGGEYFQWWKKALTLISSGGVHSNKSFPGREHAISLSNLEFQYMGYSDVPASLLKELACYSYRRNLKKKRQDTATKKRTNYSRCRDIPRDIHRTCTNRCIHNIHISSVIYSNTLRTYVITVLSKSWTTSKLSISRSRAAPFCNRVSIAIEF
jgi:Flavodoxin-like fold